ncbi:NADH-ubiquinone oxidoreductase-F iron-sulfur binding region domain-containing protein [Labedaea rhizosphaerae]|uniref:NADH dehydrogenase subunit F n=1 Tax=Labedaea rhizosphaerae TaxID=598644 RepID=A0A4R6SC14_LABRH|nr:NADH-ubiquinone oxidoreductase-F iron-sulfur binding region domain-containing protein [Labedaea rhizosphaerae]TDP96566.1 NADH dehydrogenase subunit F [Labedaea rhizosphaerae]
MTTMDTRVQPRLLDAAAADLGEHHRGHGPIPWQGGVGRMIGELQSAGLTGRGGAGFPTWRKVAEVATAARAVVVANGAETEPGSRKDDTLLRRCPHLVLDGVQLLVEATGADEAYLYVKPGDAMASVRHALTERHGWDRVAVRVVAAPNRFVAGEESAVLAAIAGRPARPADKWLPVVHSGLRGRATLVQNVETCAHVAQIARNGARWFRGLGTRDEPGTMLVTVHGAVREVPIGIALSELVTGPVLVGGYHGAWLSSPAPHLSRAALAPFGAAPGAGVLHPLAPGRCGLVETAAITRYLAGESAGQCGPCRNGLPATAALLSALADRTAPPDAVHRLDHLTGLVVGRGACRHPDGTARLIRSTLTVFGDEVRLHLAGRCSR